MSFRGNPNGMGMGGMGGMGGPFMPHPFMGMGGPFGGKMMVFNEPKIWQIQYDTNPEKTLFGPYGTKEIAHYYRDRQFCQIFGNGLEKTKGQIKMKRLTDTKWAEFDEIGLLLLMNNLPINSSSIPYNALDNYINTLFRKHSGLWIYRYGPYGCKIFGPHAVAELKTVEWRKCDDGIYVKRIGEEGWYEGGDIQMTILFYHLNRHKDYIPALGIQYIEEAVQRAHTAKLRPHFQYDEWNIIRLLMKAMRIDQYYDELYRYCQEQEVTSYHHFYFVPYFIFISIFNKITSVYFK